MKKSLLLAFGVVLIVSLSACGSKKNDVIEEGNVAIDQENTVVEKVVEKKTSLTESDLDAIENENLPISYSYQVYEGDADISIDSGSYIYTTSNSETLIPESKDMSNRKVVSSRLENGFIYTVSEVIFKDGSTGVISYINDPDSLKYLSTVVERGGNVVVYNFDY